MLTTKRQKIIISIVAVIALLGAYIVFDRKFKTSNLSSTSEIIATSTTTTTTTTDSDNKIVTTSNGNYKIEQVSTTGSPEVSQLIPDLNRPATPLGSANVAPESKAMTKEKIPLLQARLKKNLKDFPAWIDLGIYQKMAGDYQGSVISWVYASKLSSTDFVSLGNLGDLYAYFLKDKIKSEMYYKQAISKAPTEAYLYTQLADIYRYVFKDLDKARTIINQGLSKIPNDANLLQMKASLSTL